MENKDFYYYIWRSKETGLPYMTYVKEDGTSLFSVEFGSDGEIERAIKFWESQGIEIVYSKEVKQNDYCK